MSARLDVEKAVQAAGVLLRREGKRMSRLRMLKLLYIADRRSLQQTGRPILGAKVVAMKHGPLHSEVLDLINGNHIKEATWSKYFCNEGRNVRLEEEPDVGRLSRQEIALLNEVSDELANLNDWEVADLTHGFEEWRKNYADALADTSIPIPLEDIIDAVDRSADKQSIIEDIRESDTFAQFFSGLAPAED